MNSHTVPNFLGVGPPKCGTSWLDRALRLHPQVFLPRYQKEVFFFCKYYDRGFDWYAQLFRDSADYSAIGEISTSYISTNEFLNRIYQFNPEIKIIAILRDPLARLISHYNMSRENATSKTSLRKTIEANPILLEHSRYAKRLNDLKQNFRRHQVFLAIFEEMFCDQSSQVAALQNIASFLEIDPTLVPQELPGGPVRQTMGAPRHARLTRFAKRVRRKLRDSDLERLVHNLDRIGVNRSLFIKAAPIDAGASEQELAEFDDMFAADRAAVEAFLGRPVDAWRKRAMGRR